MKVARALARPVVRGLGTGPASTMAASAAEAQLQLAQNFQQQLTLHQQQQQGVPNPNFIGLHPGANGLSLQAQACGGAVQGGPGLMPGGGVLTSTAVGGSLRAHRVNST